MIKIDKVLENKLLSLPESGMGFQIVNATFSDRTVRESIFLNANILEPINNRPINEVFNAMFSANVDQQDKSFENSTNYPYFDNSYIFLFSISKEIEKKNLCKSIL